MSSLALAGRSYRCGARSILSPQLFPRSVASRAASLNSAIGRGLRRSKGIGFRGKEKSQKSQDGFKESLHGRDGPVRRTADPPLNTVRTQVTRDAWRNEHATPRSRRRDTASSTSPTVRIRRGKKDITDDKEPPRRSRAARFNDPNHSFGKKSLVRRSEAIVGSTEQYKEGGLSIRKRNLNDTGEVSGGRRRPQISSASRRAAESDRTAMQRNPDGSKLSKSRLAYLGRVGEGEERRNVAASSDRSTRDYGREGQVPSRIDGYRPRFANTEALRPLADAAGKDLPMLRPAFTPKMDNRLPLSIPYTTPASEFLYGTSVVEAALRSARSPRRKLYKLYVYSGENRENADRDAGIERLAKKTGVEVVHVDTNWLRFMDKMSSGRPHNGYILEASPLPKLPITSLGELTTQDGQPGFSVAVDHQSREEAAVNGTSNFIPLARSVRGSKPFILLLDSILDPGNLGGIIRTASFLGVTAIAISSRNSASFTPVVLKASAGASENVTLFSINKPAGFIADSKLAGWKIYAAVAPSSGARTSTVPALVTTDELDAPLENDPVLLMLGNEGEGLRWNLRSKADVEVAIEGSGGRGSVDSLNVSVAAGILCSAFLRPGDGPRIQRRVVDDREIEAQAPTKTPQTKRDLF